jgi:class 3 adenylate cyclase
VKTTATSPGDVRRTARDPVRLAIADGARQLGIDVRIGLHTGEVERR